MLSIGTQRVVTFHTKQSKTIPKHTHVDDVSIQNTGLLLGIGIFAN